MKQTVESHEIKLFGTGQEDTSVDRCRPQANVPPIIQVLQGNAGPRQIQLEGKQGEGSRGVLGRQQHGGRIFGGHLLVSHTVLLLVLLCVSALTCCSWLEACLGVSVRVRRSDLTGAKVSDGSVVASCMES